MAEGSGTHPAQLAHDTWISRATPEDPVDPDIPIVDAHHHLWFHNVGVRPFVADYMLRELAGASYTLLVLRPFDNSAAPQSTNCQVRFRPQYKRDTDRNDKTHAHHCMSITAITLLHIRT
jgi:hypothetical protein